VLLVAVYAVIFAVPGGRNWLRLAPLSLLDIGLICASVVVWAVALLLLWRTNLFEKALEMD